MNKDHEFIMARQLAIMEHCKDKDESEIILDPYCKFEAFGHEFSAICSPVYWEDSYSRDEFLSCVERIKRHMADDWIHVLKEGNHDRKFRKLVIEELKRIPGILGMFSEFKINNSDYTTLVYNVLNGIPIVEAVIDFIYSKATRKGYSRVSLNHAVHTNEYLALLLDMIDNCESTYYDLRTELYQLEDKKRQIEQALDQQKRLLKQRLNEYSLVAQKVNQIKNQLNDDHIYPIIEKCKWRGCDQPALIDGLCFFHRKHDNYEVD